MNCPEIRMHTPVQTYFRQSGADNAKQKQDAGSISKANGRYT